MVRSPLIIVAIALRAAGALAQPSSTITERIPAMGDSTMHYALLEARAPVGQARPVLLVMDPLGRAVEALERFRAGAERTGWIVLSSYETSGEVEDAPNARAVNAMLADAVRRWGGDPDRIYLAGLSGTARAAWVFAAELRIGVAGILAAGGGIAPYRELAALLARQPAGLAYASVAGSLDYNWLEVRETSVLLRERGMRQREWSFEGRQDWPPSDVAAEMLEWLAGAAGSARTEADTVSSEARAREKRVLAAERRALDNIGVALSRARISPKLPTAARVRADLRIDALMRDARSADRETARSAARRLEYILVELTHYQPRAYLAAVNPARARVMLNVAEVIDPARASAAREQLGIRE